MDDKEIFWCLKFNGFYRQPYDRSALTCFSTVNIQTCIYPVFHYQPAWFLYVILLHLLPCVHYIQSGC